MMDEQGTFETMVAGLVEFIHGKGKAGINKQLDEAKDEESLAKAVGTIAFTLTQEAAQQAKSAKQELSMDILLGVATEVIDALSRVLAVKRRLPKDVETFGKKALIFAIHAYLMTSKPSPEEQEEAKAMLAEMQQGGMVDEAVGQLDELGKQTGTDAFADVKPKQAPMAEGIQRGLMGAT